MVYTPLPWQPRENISRKQASRDITGAKKHIYAQGRLNPVISQPKYGRCERQQGIVIDNNEGVKSHQSTHTQMQQLAVSFNFALLRESPQSIEKENASLNHAATNARKPTT